MSLRLPDKWVWDFWVVERGPEHHIFYLQAPRTLEMPELRHHHASIGHAVSRDLRRWRVLPDALHPGPDGSWDDLATWTGSTIEWDGRWYMLYTGISRREEGLIQRIGLAVSDDLITWVKYSGNPVLEADPRWYDLLDLPRWRDQSWRDPWLVRHPDDGSFHCLITARSPLGASDSAGVIGHARSLDLVEWEVLPPVTQPGDFAQVEAPQLVPVDGWFALLVSCQAEDHSRERMERTGAIGETGTFFFSGNDMFGPYTAPGRPIAAPDGPLGPLYAGKILSRGPEKQVFMAFRGDGDRDFLGELIDPLPVTFDAEGQALLKFPRVRAGAEL